MKVTIDTDGEVIRCCRDGRADEIGLYSKAGFELLSALWLKVGWNEKYTYTFSWLGRPIIQLPEDMFRTQEVIHRIRPGVIIETGVAHGGSLVFYASLCEAMGAGHVVGVDIEIRPHNRKAIEEHPLARRITLIEGDSIAPDVVDRVRAIIAPGDRVLVLLDSNHSYGHVLGELKAYAPLVSVDSYIVATDGYMRELTDVPRGKPAWSKDNPAQAAEDFVSLHPSFQLEQPPWPFNESALDRNVTHWPSAWLRRIRPDD
jgi:cephalosporin hydroxylase